MGNTVNITELRNHLRTYLRKVRAGEEVLVRDRTQAVAKIVPVSICESSDTRLLRMAAEGIVRLPEKNLDLKSFFAMRAPRIPMAKLKGAIEAEREED